jgi:hypothetical protein
VLPQAYLPGAEIVPDGAGVQLGLVDRRTDMRLGDGEGDHRYRQRQVHGDGGEQPPEGPLIAGLLFYDAGLCSGGLLGDHDRPVRQRRHLTAVHGHPR